MKKRVEVKNNNRDSNRPIRQQATFAQKAADKLTTWIGSWKFIILFLTVLLIWILNIFYAAGKQWDIDPFFLLNLVLSCIAAIQAPIILMSQNRASQKERLRVEYDYQVDKKSGRDIEDLKKQLNRIEKKLG